MRIGGSVAKGLLISMILALIPPSAYGTSHAGPKTPSCGNYKVSTNEIIAGVKFPKGTYQINTFGISCTKVMGSKGLFAQFLKLKDKDPLPKPWRYLVDAVGAPKFSSGPGVGFRVQLITPTPTPTPTATPTITPTPTATPTPENLSLSDPVLNCKIKDASNPEVGQYGGALYGGFIEKDRPIPSSGTVTWYLIPLDFSDLKGESNWRTRVDQQIQLLTEYYETVSYGKLKIQWKVYDNWITLPGTQLKFAINQSGDYIATENFWKDAISVVDPKVDFTGVQVVNFLLPRDQSDFKESAQGFPWTGDINKYNASEGKLSAFTLLGKFFEASQRTYWSYWAHEYGHTLGIPHISGSRSTSTFQTCDLMGNQDSRRELSGWSRFAVTKWIEDEWVFCKDKANIKSEIVNLTKLNSKEAGHKIIVIPLSPTKSLIVESRMTNKFSGIDSIKGRTDGVFVYTYDATLGHNEDYFTQASLETDPILIRGESVTYDGVTIKVLSVGSQDKILITKQ